MGQLLLRARRRHRPGLGHGHRRLRGAVRGLDLQPAHGGGAVPAGLDQHRHSQRLPGRRVQPAVRDLRAGHAAAAGRAGGRAAVPGRHVQHRRAEPVHRRRDPGHLPRLRGQPAARHTRDRLRARRLRRRRRARLGGRRAQGQDGRARGDHHDHAQLHHGLPALVPARQRHAAAGPERPDQPVHCRQRAPAAPVRPDAADQRGVPRRPGLRVRHVVAAVPDHDRVRVPRHRQEPERGPGGGHERGAIPGCW